MIGKSIAHYEITGLLGKGGMGEVYLAHDAKLDRDVAFKVLPAEVADDPERAARFEREARMLASLQHPNIASIYGYEHVDGVRFLTMELAEGENLTQRLEREGRLPLEDALQIARQIATGLEAAHDKNIVHRDLKPANIMVDADGGVKILDFGLARAYAGDAIDREEVGTSPTITAGMTQMGVILGTAAYMSPEQAKGKSVDRRSDIWSFGVLLFEMLCGRKLFEGETMSETMADVMKSEIDWSMLPGETPRWLVALLLRCLDRDPSTRLQSIGEARIALQRGGDEEAEDAAAPTGVTASRGWPLIGVGAALLVLAAAVVWHGLREAPPQPLVQSTLMPPAGWDFDSGSPFAVSPDGRRIAFVANAKHDNGANPGETSSIWLRDLAEAESHRLEGTEGASYPFWSPDGGQVAFFANSKLNKIDVRGGPVIALCDTRDGRGGTWNESGTIIFQRGWSEGLMKIPAGGGAPVPITTLNEERFDVAHRWPSFLPDGRRFIFFVVSTTSTVGSEYSGIYLGSLDSDETRQLLTSESRALYSRGHLLFRIGSTLMARPFDPDEAAFTGDPIPVASDVPGGAISWGGAQFGVSESGLLVHLRGAGATSSLLNWRDREGNLIDVSGDPAGYWEPAISHDGSRIAVSIGHDAGDIWLHDLERNVRTRFSFDPADDRSPLWSGDDSRIVFASGRKMVGEIYERAVSGQGEARLLYATGMNITLDDWSSDDRWIFYSGLAPGDKGWDIWAFNTEAAEAKPLLHGPFNEANARLSPDGRWLAFDSDESGRPEVYVQSFPNADGRWMVSDEGGSQALWREDGRELYYLSADGVVTSVDVAGDSYFSFGKPRPLFSVGVKSSTGRNWSVSRDGRRFLANERPPVDQDKIGARLIQNWSAGLRQ